MPDNLVEILKQEIQILIAERDKAHKVIAGLRDRLEVIDKRMTAIDKVIAVYVATGHNPDTLSSEPEQISVSHEIATQTEKSLADPVVMAVEPKETAVNNVNDSVNNKTEQEKTKKQKLVERFGNFSSNRTVDQMIITPERTALMLREYPIGRSSYELLTMLNALPGVKLRNTKNVENYATRIKVKRNPGVAINKKPKENSALLKKPVSEKPKVKNITKTYNGVIPGTVTRAVENDILKREYAIGTPEKRILELINQNQACRPFRNVSRMRQHARRIGAYQLPKELPAEPVKHEKEVVPAYQKFQPVFEKAKTGEITLVCWNYIVPGSKVTVEITANRYCKEFLKYIPQKKGWGKKTFEFSFQPYCVKNNSGNFYKIDSSIDPVKGYIDIMEDDTLSSAVLNFDLDKNVASGLRLHGKLSFSRKIDLGNGREEIQEIVSRPDFFIGDIHRNENQPVKPQKPIIQKKSNPKVLPKENPARQPKPETFNKTVNPPAKSNRWMPSDEDIQRYIAQKGVTRLPPAKAAETTANISPEDYKIIREHNRNMVMKRLKNIKNK